MVSLDPKAVALRQSARLDNVAKGALDKGAISPELFRQLTDGRVSNVDLSDIRRVLNGLEHHEMFPPEGSTLEERQATWGKLDIARELEQSAQLVFHNQNSSVGGALRTVFVDNIVDLSVKLATALKSLP